ncbi:unnamed protein product, partial [Prorocentrum cordatum]
MCLPAPSLRPGGLGGAPGLGMGGLPAGLAGLMRPGMPGDSQDSECPGGRACRGWAAACQVASLAWACRAPAACLAWLACQACQGCPASGGPQGWAACEALGAALGAAGARRAGLGRERE